MTGADTPALDLQVGPGGQRVLDSLVEILDLEQIEVDIFRGVSPAVSLQRVFGGQVAGQALVAAGRTVDPEREVHSLHAYFLRPGDPSVPIVYLIDRIRDGRSFTTRRVIAVQHGRAIFNMSASFCRPETGLDTQSAMPDVPPPEELPTLVERYAAATGPVGPMATLPRPFDLRYVDDPPWVQRALGPREARSRVWMRADGVLPADRLVHVCALTYASDLTLLSSVLVGQDLTNGAHDIRMASLDHAMWFHRPFRVDEWLLYDCESPSAFGARGLATGHIWAQDGRHVASVVQEGLLRISRPPTPSPPRD